MTREIKFRAWDNLQRKMIENVCVYHGMVYISPLHDSITTADKAMQLTGILDKHGREIYEGDIIKFEIPRYKAIWEVRWVNFGFRLVDGIGYRLLESDQYPKVSEEGEIIGNIYENPSIIEEK